MSEKNIDHRIDIGNRIAEIRKQRGLTQTELSKITGLKQVNISKIENGKYGVGIDVLNTIAKALFMEINLKEMEYITNIESRLKNLAFGDDCYIQREIEINEEATMFHFVCDSCEAACIVYEDGTLFHLYDWQSGRPSTAEEIEEYDWVREDDVRAIVFNGLPRVLE